MKREQKIKLGFLIILMICVIVMIGMLISSYIYHHPNVKAGQVWVKEYFIDDPYREVRRDTIVIINTKGDYCLYINKSSGDTVSDTKHWAVICARRLKDND